MSKIKLDVGLGKAAAINSIGNMATQGMQNSHEMEMLEKQEENEKLSAIQNYEFSNDSGEFLKQFIGMCEDYKSSFELNSEISETYFNRMEKETKIVKLTNPDLYAKISPLFEEINTFLTEAKLKDKKSTKKFLIGCLFFMVALGVTYLILYLTGAMG